MPGRSSPPMPLRSSTWWSSALTSVPASWPAAGMDHHSRRLVDDDDVSILIEDVERQILGHASAATGAGMSTVTRSPSRTAMFGARLPPVDA